ncbi:serine/threonine protein kinase, partial [Myxococcota bacterium]|nr:serine/threonine protein kinase [Myxococcota bacterium]
MAAPEQTVKPFAGPELTTRELRDLGCGRPLGRFTLLRRIATGGMAEVYVARAKGISGFEKKVAIKKILPQHSHNERFVDMLVDEAKITVSLTHPNIAQVYELGLDGDDEYFIVMEWVDGRPLNKLMQRVDERGLDTIPVAHAAHVMAEISKGLDHAHKQKDQRGYPLSIVHRDVSPQNVLVSYQGDVKLIDFGIARAEGRAAQTSHGVIKGKLRYLAPEIAAGDEPDHRADVYCCGIVLFEMLTGEAMFAPKSDMEAIAMASEARVRSPRSRNPKVPQDLDDICMRALRRDRNDRYQSAKDLHGELRRFLNQHYPAYLGSELGDFMQGMFAQEIVAERRLDAIVERYAERASDDDDDALDDDLEDPTTVGKLELRPSTAVRRGASIVEGAAKKPYKPIVTRLAIGAERTSRPEVKLIGADGGEPMGVVLHEAGSERPPIRFESAHAKHPGTLPPIAQAETVRPPEVVALDEAGFDDGSAEPTRRASNPLVATS